MFQHAHTNTASHSDLSDGYYWSDPAFPPPPEFAMMVSILNQHSGVIEMNAAFFDEVLVGLSVALRNHPSPFTPSHTVSLLIAHPP